LALKDSRRIADTGHVDEAQRAEILSRYREHTRRFESVAARRQPGIENVTVLRPAEPDPAPTAREIEVLELIEPLRVSCRLFGLSLGLLA